MDFLFKKNRFFEHLFSDEPTKVSLHMNEVYPGLLETLQINNNKQRLPALNRETMSRNI